MRTRLAAVLLLVAAATQPSHAQATTAQAQRAQPPAGWSAFARQFAAYADSDRVVGATVVYLRNGSTVARHDAGFQDKGAGRVVDSLTIHHWGSITKTLTAVAIMQLRDRKRLSLDDKVVRYLPELRRVHDPFGRIDSITIRMLLSHSAGFRNGTWPYGDGNAWEPFEPTEWSQLVAMMPYQQLLFPPGARYSYSNPAFVYLARIIESLTGDPWDAYVQKNIFAPLGMSRSYFRSTPYHLAAHRSHNYVVRRDSASGAPRVMENPTEFDPGITTPNGGWNAPVSDVARWAAFLGNTVPPGATRALYDTVLRRASLEEMWTPVVPMSSGYEAAQGQSMGLSFFVRSETGGARIIGHTGSQAGFRSFMYFNPANGTAIVAVFNSTNYADAKGAAYDRVHRAAQQLLVTDR